MLGLTLERDGDFLVIGDSIEIRISRVSGQRVHLDVWAPRSMTVLRGKLFIKRVIEQGGNIDDAMRRLPSGMDDCGCGVDDAEDATFWAAEEEANERIAM